MRIEGVNIRSFYNRVWQSIVTVMSVLAAIIIMCFSLNFKYKGGMIGPLDSDLYSLPSSFSAAPSHSLKPASVTQWMSVDL